MYSNIETEDCINRLSEYLLDPITPPPAITEALSLVMLNNRMRFNNIVVKQHKGIAMGVSPASTIANLYVSIFEKQHLLP